MARSTVTLDIETTRQLDAIEARDACEAVRRVVASPASEDGHRLWSSLARSVEELGDNPSRSAVIRQALDYYLASLREARRISELESGYAALARDEDRARTVRAMRDRLPERFDED